jgi:general secretion pathway protein E
MNARQILTPELLAELQAAAGGRVDGVLDALEARLGLPPDDFVALLGERMGYPAYTAAALASGMADFNALGFAEAQARQCCVLRLADGTLCVAVADPFDRAQLNALDARLPGAYQLVLAHRQDITAWLTRQETELRALDPAALGEGSDSEAGSETETLSLASIAEDESPVVRLVHSTLYDALKSNASDIHLESDPQGLSVKYRIDGVLVRVARAAGVTHAEQVISRVKVMAELDIAERRIPQDGRFRAHIQGRDVDFRVSIMPSVHGEDAVLRLLDRKALTGQLATLTLPALGLAGETLERLRRLIRIPYGMCLVTGPTGSGKTTTLYAALTEINSGEDKIITIEDPVEYQLPGILQIPVNEKKGLSFARGLRSILRHDPDKIMVGEIRDAETAQIAIQSALTGHLVLSTVHANNAFDVMSRFRQLGVDDYSFVSAMQGILAQRLLRRLCTHCREPDGSHWRAGPGCGQCRGTGYRGRLVVAELLVFDDRLRELILARAPISALKQAAREQGMASLREAAQGHVMQGETSQEEVDRVVV